MPSPRTCLYFAPLARTQLCRRRWANGNSAPIILIDNPSKLKGPTTSLVTLEVRFLRTGSLSGRIVTETQMNCSAKNDALTYLSSLSLSLSVCFYVCVRVFFAVGLCSVRRHRRLCRKGKTWSVPHLFARTIPCLLKTINA